MAHPTHRSEPLVEEHEAFSSDDAWDKLLTPMAQLKLAATRGERGGAPGDQMSRLLEVATEMRDRMRYSQRRMVELKAELRHTRQQAAADLAALQHRLDAEVAAAHQQAAAQVAAAQQQAAGQVAGTQEQTAQVLRQVEAERSRERQQAEAKVAALQAEVDRLSQGAAGQAASLEAQAHEARALRAELSEARVAQGRAQAELQGALRRADQARKELEGAAGEVARLRQALGDAQQRAQAAERQAAEARDASVQLKRRLAEISQAESLYKAARDEMGRLRNENQELKDMVVHEVEGGGAALGRSRILEALSPGRLKSVPLHLTPEAQGKRRSAVTGRRAGSPPRRAALDPARHMGRIHVARDVLFDLQDGPLAFPRPLTADGPGAAAVGAARGRSPSPGRGGASPREGSTPVSAEALRELVWLGPPCSAYPPGAEQYEYLRVAGGYAPCCTGATLDVPKASGWVPKQVVRAVQAFRHAYGLEQPAWRHWEPLLLLLDEAYRRKEQHAVAATRAASAGRVRAAGRAAQAALAYPSQVQAGRVAHLKRQLEALRRGMAAVEARRDDTLRHVARKDWHLLNQLDEAVEQNLALRASLEELDQLLHSGDEREDDGGQAVTVEAL